MAGCLLPAGYVRIFVFGHAKKRRPAATGKNIFIAGNYGVSASNYTAKGNRRRKKSLSTKVWNAGLGVHLAGFELAYFIKTCGCKT